MPKETIQCDVAVIGAGLAGLSAALYASSRGADTLIAGPASGIIFASGYLDLLAVHPVAGQKVWDDPWAALAALTKAEPQHPYARVGAETVARAFDELLEFLLQAGLPYHREKGKNLVLPTTVGTVKPSFAVPSTMAPGGQGLLEKPPCVLVGLRGLKGFSSRQIAENLRPCWPGLSHARAVFPGTEAMSEVYGEKLARLLEVPANRERLAETLRPHAAGVKMMGLPAILGIYHPAEIAADLSRMLGVTVFEIPTIPPSVPGIRLREAFLRRLPEKGVHTLFKKTVLPATVTPGQDLVITATDDAGDLEIRAKSVILATGRFLGKGLAADRRKVRETVFNLPVTQPEKRSAWHQKDFLDPKGHLVNRAGIETDENLRPLAKNHQPAHENLYAAGTILAHQDWMREKSGAGISISTALYAVEKALG
ncbi:MAG: glycerol-3-phosphate dehydrogenase subunit GlpB [Pseudomonadota bacterium]